MSSLESQRVSAHIAYRCGVGVGGRAAAHSHALHESIRRRPYVTPASIITPINQNAHGVLIANTKGSPSPTRRLTPLAPVATRRPPPAPALRHTTGV
jgi:hypothetical protein